MLQTIQNRELPRSVAAMEQLAEHYHIPSINFGLEVARLEREGRLIFKGAKPTNETQRAALGDTMVFSSDAVHPFSDTGHELYAQAVARAFNRLRTEPEKSSPHSLGDPFRQDHWEAAQLIPIERELLRGRWVLLDPATSSTARDFRNRLPKMWTADQVGDAMEFRFRGTAVAVYDLLGPDCGQLRLMLDGIDQGLRPRFDAYCTYHRLGTTWIGSGLSNTTHTVRLTIAPESLDKSRILAQRNEKMDRPERFQGKAWYAGALLLVGELER